MVRFIKKTLGFIVIPLLVLLFVIIILNVFLNQTLFDDYSFDYSVESKIYMLKDTNNINIIVAGDSRGERQLIPQVIKSITDINSINIAVSSGDLTSTVHALSAFSDSNIFIISASSWQINDGSVDYGYLSMKSFQQLTILEQFDIYRYNIAKLTKMYIEILKSALDKIIVNEDKYYYDEKIIREYGFLGIEDTIKVDTAQIASLLLSHAWYKNLNSNGSRWRVFNESFKKLDDRKALVIIYQPPVSPIWKEKIKNTVIDQFEKEYSKRLDSLCDMSDNIVFYDFYAQNLRQIDNSMYYDVQHLNRNGAEIFSNILSNIVMDEIKARTNDIGYEK